MSKNDKNHQKFGFWFFSKYDLWPGIVLFRPKKWPKGPLRSLKHHWKILWPHLKNWWKKVEKTYPPKKALFFLGGGGIWRPYNRNVTCAEQKEGTMQRRKKACDKKQNINYLPLHKPSWDYSWGNHQQRHLATILMLALPQNLLDPWRLRLQMLQLIKKKLQSSIDPT